MVLDDALDACGMVAILRGVTPDELMRRESVMRRVHEVEVELQHHHSDWAERMAKWEDEIKDNQPAWTIIQPIVEEISTGGERYLTNADGSFLAQGYKPTKHTVRMEIKTELNLGLLLNFK